MRQWIVAGEPAVWLGSGEKAWKLALASAVNLDPLAPPAVLDLEFRVGSFLRSGRPFDLDNMVTPVFEAVLGGRHSAYRRALEGWTARRTESATPGLTLSAGAPGAAPANGAHRVLDVVIPGRLPIDSREGGAQFVAALRDALGPWSPALAHRFDVSLEFGDDVHDVTWVAERPVKPVVDCLFPVFGGSAGAPEDWKMHSMSVRRGRPDLRGSCRIVVHEVPVIAGAHAAPRATAGVPDARVRPSGAAAWSGITQGECLDEAAKSLGSPPAEVRLAELLARAAELFPEMARVSRASASATMDFQTINVRGRANRPGNFDAGDRWNRSPAFVKVLPGTWRRLSDAERAAFHRLWAAREPLLRQEAFSAADWESLVRWNA